MTLSILDRPTTLRSRAYEAVKASIITGELAPGSLGSEAGLARQFGISRGPLREAIRQLKEEGLIADVSSSGFIVAPLDETTISEVYGVRLALESMAARLAAIRIELTTIEAFEIELAHFQGMSEDELYLAFTANDLRFHDLWVLNSGNELLIRHIGRLRDHISRIMNQISGLPLSHFQAALREHFEILAAFRSREQTLIQKAVENHIASARDRLLVAFHKGQDGKHRETSIFDRL